TSAQVDALTGGVLKAVLLSKLKIATVMALAVVLVACAVLHLPRDAQGDDESKPGQGGPRAHADQPKAAPAWKEVASFGEHKAPVEVIALGPGLVVTGGPEGVVRIWDITKQQLIRTYASSPRKELPVHALSFSPDGKYLTCIAEGGAISVLPVSG